MSTYRVFILNTANVEAPVVTIGFMSADKYGPAWSHARAYCSGEEKLDGGEKVKPIFADTELKTPLKGVAGKDFTVAKILDMKPRNSKLDKAALAAALADTTGTPEEQLARMRALIGQPAPAAPAKEQQPAA